MKAHVLEPYLLPIAIRQHKLLERRVLAGVFGLFAMVGLGLYLSGTTWGISAAWFFGAILTALLATRWCAKRAFNYEGIARRIESEHPELRSLLVTAMEQAPESGRYRFNFLQKRVIDEAINKAIQQNWIQTVSEKALKHARGLELVAGASFAILFLLLAKGLIESSIYTAQSMTRAVSPVSPVTPDYEVEVTPGDVEVEAGDRLVIRARFPGAVPDDVVLMAGQSNEELQALPMKKNLEDPVFGGIIPTVNQAMVYRVDFEDHQSELYAISVFRYPALERANAQVRPPSYSKLPEEKIDDTLYINVLERSAVALQFVLNKPVAEARLVPKEGATIELKAHQEIPRMVEAEIVALKTMAYQLELVDEQGRANRKSVEFLIQVRPNLPPELKFVFPRKDSTVSPLQEMLVEAEVYDDLGLIDYGMAYSLDDHDAEISLGSGSAETGRKTFNHLLEMEELKAEPNQFVAYHLWAEDLGPDGEKRRTVSDIYFAEVRHFEEIYRERQAPPSESEEPGEQAPKADELLKEAKEIISATWNVKRMVDLDGDLESRTNDVQVIRDALQGLTDKSNQVMALLEDPETLQHLEDAIVHMQQAISDTEDLLENQDAKYFKPLMSTEQAAYAALIRMRGREHQVMRAQRSKSKGKSQAESQRPEINELELKQQERLYETEREAKKEQQTQEEEEQRENLQVLNRLRELARRQDEVKEKLQEVKHALELAQDEAEKERLMRELKRLEEQQQELLSDVDELRQRMDQQENRERMAEAKKEVNEIRKEVQETKEQMEQKQLDDAVNSSARAKEKLDELREEFRKQAAGRFDEEMREMRQEARELSSAQNELKEQLTEPQSAAKEQPKRLDDTPDEGSPLAEQLEQQREDVQALVKQMIDISREAENAEPLLSRRLHDTVREASSNELETEMARTSDYLRFNRESEAKESITKSSQAVEDLKDGIEKAAETVLGDEASALRKAKNELEDVIDQLNQEIQQARGRNAPSNGTAQAETAAGETPPGPPSGQEPTEGQEAKPQPGEGQQPQPGEGQPPQPGEGQQPQPGEGQQPQPGEGQQPQPGAGQPPQPGEGQPPQPGEGQQPQPGEGQQPQPGEGQPPQPGEGQQPQPGEGQQPQPGEGQQPQPGAGQQPQPGEGQQPQPGAGQQPQPGEGQQPQPGEDQQSAPTGGTMDPNGGGNFQDFTQGPITGTEFKQWSDQLRDIEEMLDRPELRDEAARIRDRAKSERAAFRRHSKEPEWEVVQDQVLKPLVELQQRVQEALAKAEDKDALVPIDRDPVPRKFEDLVRRYYQKLGEGD